MKAVAATPPRICLVSASGQNVFFAEILEAFAAALRDQGVVVEASVDCFPPPADDLVYLYVPHEYHPLVEDLAHPTPKQLGRSIALCTEQPGTHWFELTSSIAASAGGTSRKRPKRKSAPRRMASTVISRSRVLLPRA